MSQSSSTYRFRMSIPEQVRIGGKRLSREDFFAWIWEEFLPRGLLGIHEGTLLAEQAAQEGLETDSWTVDAGEAPRERDWVSSQKDTEAEFYFGSLEGARLCAEKVAELGDFSMSDVEEQKPQDWDAQWKAAFLSSPTGLKVPPFWRILPAILKFLFPNQCTPLT